MSACVSAWANASSAGAWLTNRVTAMRSPLPSPSAARGSSRDTCVGSQDMIPAGAVIGKPNQQPGTIGLCVISPLHAAVASYRSGGARIVGADKIKCFFGVPVWLDLLPDMSDGSVGADVEGRARDAHVRI